MARFRGVSVMICSISLIIFGWLRRRSRRRDRLLILEFDSVKNCVGCEEQFLLSFAFFLLFLEDFEFRDEGTFVACIFTFDEFSSCCDDGILVIVVVIIIVRIVIITIFDLLFRVDVVQATNLLKVRTTFV